MTARSLLFLALAPVASSTAAAQSFNVDVGMNLAVIAGLPDASYGAAAGQAGAWNAFMPTLTATPLSALDGSASAVTLRADATSTFNIFPGVMTPGNDQKLMEDFHVTPNLNTPSTWTFEGLVDGDYTVYTYASDPTPSAAPTQITVLGSQSPAQVVGAGWPGSHGLGQTYAEHDVAVSGGALVIVGLVVGGQLDSGVINGFQVVQKGGLLTTNYCMTNPNVTGLPAVMSAVGTSVTALNDVTLQCSQMTPSAFGYFLASRQQGFVAFPGGSLGNLCLSGSIGRYSGPGQIQNSGLNGMISLRIDLTQMPTAGGFVSVQAGESWNFQAWFRDVSAAPASNFSDGFEITFL